MDPPSPAMRDLARRLLAVETASQDTAGMHMHEAARVYEKLRISLTRFAGPDGFTSLLRRALALSRAEVPWLASAQVKPDGSLQGIEKAAPDADDRETEAAIAITAHLLGLLVTFIGEPLTLRLVRDAWPAAPLSEEVGGE